MNEPKYSVHPYSGYLFSLMVLAAIFVFSLYNSDNFLIRRFQPLLAIPILGTFFFLVGMIIRFLSARLIRNNVKVSMWLICLLVLGVSVVNVSGINQDFLRWEISLIKRLNIPGFIVDSSIKYGIIIAFLGILGITVGWLAVKHQRVFLILMYDCRPLRQIHFLLFFTLGMIINRNITGTGISNSFEFFLDNVLVVLAVFSGALHAIISNNRIDVEADRISNPGRPTLTGVISDRLYHKIAIVSLIISILCSLMVNTAFFLIMFIITGCYFLYSAPPYRLKRIPVLAKFIIGFNTWLICLAGFHSYSAATNPFPWEYSFFLLIPFALAGNFIDLKDVEGDRATSVKTLPVLFGLRVAQIMIWIFTLFSYMWVLYIINEKMNLFLYVSFFGLMLVHSLFLIRKNYRELPVMICYLVSILSLLIIELLNF